MAPCMLCGNLVAEEAMLDHLNHGCTKSHDGFLCLTCSSTFQGFAAYSSHYLLCQAVPAANERPPAGYDIHYCIYCRRFESNDPAEFERHVPECLDTSSLFCQKCDIVIGDMRALNAHMLECRVGPFPLPLPPQPPEPLTDMGPSGSGKVSGKKSRNKNKKK